MRFWLILTWGLLVSESACGGTGPLPNPTNSALPPPRAGAIACPKVNAEIALVQHLASGGIKVTAVTGSVGEGLFRNAKSVCSMDVDKGSFEVAFFADAATASAVHVCDSRSGNRYIYQLEDRTIDAAYPLFWSVSGADLIWTPSAELDVSLRRVLGGIRPLC